MIVQHESVVAPPLSSRCRPTCPLTNTATQDPDGTIWISGHDSAGWTLDGYVIPRLQSGMISAVEIDGQAQTTRPTLTHPSLHDTPLTVRAPTAPTT